ncbi:DUF808 domain-containing protein [Paracoccus tibetensis]|uniref:Inner membrane protein YedI n=1 Tax=Paracoccus tibetensis TaxID=336292 RepID=A0A1G5BIZ7_9RHOB|nr:DUF808 domain-containing protein [Paracoccus tibetensis]SCX90135.1 hypothetical protein SAMN05660710_00166 [Paracoccus tibetensis]
MSGLIALLDDIGMISKMAAASLDDVAAHSVKAGAKAAGAVIDDAAVTPKYVHGFDASRELPIIWRIARGSLFNKLVILLPVALALSALLPAAIPPLLMLGGAYLCYEGAHKVAHWWTGHHDAEAHVHPEEDGPSLEETRVAGAIKTDFILSAEIMTIALSTIPVEDSLVMKAVILFVVAVAITVAVYGVVALIVKADDVGLHLAQRGRGLVAALGRGIVRVMPGVMTLLTVVGTAAMIWVGGQIITHGLYELGWGAPHHFIAHMAEEAAHAVPAAAGLVRWLVTAALDGVIGLALGLALVPLAIHVLNPLIERTVSPFFRRLRGGNGAAKKN